MKIDAHQHFWRYEPADNEWIDDSMAALRRNFLPADLQPEMAGAGIDACIAVQARQSLEETRWLLELADGNPFIAGVVGWVDLQDEDVREQLEVFARCPKLVGVRHIVQAEADDRFLLKPSFCRGVSMLEDVELAYDILIYPRHLGAAAEFVSRFRRQRFALDHMGKPDIRQGGIDEWERGIRALAEFLTCSAKSRVDYRGRLGPAGQGKTCGRIWTWRSSVSVRSRLMLGSDWPVCTVAGDY